MAMLGDLSEFSISDIFQMFERAGKTGQLSVWAPTGIHRISFYQGRIVAAIVPDDRYCLKNILLTAPDLSEAAITFLKAKTEIREPIGRSMKEQGFLSTSTLAFAFRKQIQIGVLPLFHLQAGQFRFGAGIPFPYEEMTGMSKGGMEVAMQGLRHMEKTVNTHDAFPQPDSVFVRATQELPLIKLSPLEWSIWEKVSKDYTLRELSQILKADLLEVRKGCYRLSEVGLLGAVLASSSTNKQPGMKQSAQSEREASPLPYKASIEKEGQQEDSSINPNLIHRLTSLLRSVR